MYFVFLINYFRNSIPAVNLGFSTTLRAKKPTAGDCDDDRQPEIAIWTFCSLILQFLAVGRCRSHLTNLLSSSSSLKILNLALQLTRDLSEFHICNYFRFRGPFSVVGRYCAYLPTLFYTYTWSYTPDLLLEFQLYLS